MGKHSFLSASASHRWINCPPSARLCEEYADRPSEYAQEGTDCHEQMCIRDRAEGHQNVIPLRPAL